jgi:mono/diheme cytochrome c family protein
MTRRHRTGYGLAALAGIVLIDAVLFFFLPHGLEPVSPSTAQPTGDALIARGKYLTVAADCAACHTTEGGKPFAGGLAFKLPFGTIYSSNITPDRENGIGAWTDAEFARAMRSGVGRHGARRCVEPRCLSREWTGALQ